ncbi:unnamed protein product [Polarella glacialis]|uniref:Peroxisomal membrane protein MPV17 n=1 Tax=Polarella glacialis TaxID=89957 RepID=A0A813JL94_POLGL|nr:unnamed protein product [Polarella glacialis]
MLFLLLFVYCGGVPCRSFRSMRLARGLLVRYEALLHRAPAATKGATAAGLALVGDVAAQSFEERSAAKDGSHRVSGSGSEGSLDLQRLFAFSCFAGAWSAGGLHPLYQAMQWLLPTTSAVTVVSKVVLQHAVINPFLYLPFFYIGNGLMLGKDVTEIREKAEAEYWLTLGYIWKFWIPISALNFALTPVRHQVNVANVGNLAWNMILSLLYNKEKTE